MPIAVREKLGLTAGTPVQFELRTGEVAVKKGGAPVHPVDQVFGRIKLAKPVDGLLDDMRGPRPTRLGRHARARKRRA